MKLLSILSELTKQRFNFNRDVGEIEDINPKEYLGLIKRRELLKQKLPVLGQGSSRTVFRLTSKKAIKLAHNKFGINQNKKEVEVWKNEKEKRWIPRIYSWAHDYSWVVSELVNPDMGKVAKKVYQIFGMELSELENLLTYKEAPDREMGQERKKNIESLRDFMTRHNLDAIELGEDNLGINADGELKILDTGIEKT
jgi:hypothetical protein